MTPSRSTPVDTVPTNAEGRTASAVRPSAFFSDIPSVTDSQ